MHNVHAYLCELTRDPITTILQILSVMRAKLLICQLARSDIIIIYSDTQARNTHLDLKFRYLLRPAETQIG